MIAYFILVHRYPQQFKRLFKALYAPNHCYLIHVDKRAGQSLLKEITQFLSNYQNTYLLESQNVVWGGYSMVEVELRAIKKLLALNKKWESYINLSGQDFPLKPLTELEQFLRLNNDSEFLLVSDQKKDRPNTMNRIENYFEMTDDGFSGKPYKRPYLSNTIPYIGGQWKILTRRCCEFITTHRAVTRFKEYYKNTLIADESFFQTVLMNTPYPGAIINDDKRAIIWIPDSTQRKNARRFSDNETKALVASGKIKLRPKVMALADSKFLTNTNAFFGRKFDETVDNQILNYIEKHLLKTPQTLKKSQKIFAPKFSLQL